MIYDGDSFFTLTPAARVGLAALSLGLGAVMLGLAWMVRGAWWLRFGLTAMAFWSFVWLSPQVYYTYYRAVIDGLPAQVVVQSPPTPAAIWRLLTFTGAGALNAHGIGLLGWAMIAVALWPRRGAR